MSSAISIPRSYPRLAPRAALRAMPAPATPARDASSAPRPARLIPRLPDPRLGIAARNSSVTPTPTVRPISAAVRRSRSSSCETSAPPRRGPRPVRGVWAAVVGRASVSVIAILEFLRVVENLRQPGPDAVYRRCGSHEYGFGLVLYDFDQRVELVEPCLGFLHRLEQPRIRGGHRLLDLTHVSLHDSDDLSRILGHDTRAPHERRDITVNAIQQIVHLLVRLPEVPRCRNQSDREHQQGNRRESARDRGDLFEGAGHC